MQIKINDKEYGFEWGLGAIEIFCDNNNCDVSDIDAKITSERQIEQQRAINGLFLAAIQNWCELNWEDFDLTYRQLQVAISVMPQKRYNEIIADWKRSQYYGRTIAEYYFGEIPEETTSKKKSASEE